jgi:hypothetical protein
MRSTHRIYSGFITSSTGTQVRRSGSRRSGQKAQIVGPNGGLFLNVVRDPVIAGMDVFSLYLVDANGALMDEVLTYRYDPDAGVYRFTLLNSAIPADPDASVGSKDGQLYLSAFLPVVQAASRKGLFTHLNPPNPVEPETHVARTLRHFNPSDTDQLSNVDRAAGTL